MNISEKDDFSVMLDNAVQKLEEQKEAEKNEIILPIPFNEMPAFEGIDKWKVRDWFVEINQKLDEFKAECFRLGWINQKPKYFHSCTKTEKQLLADKACDAMTAITSLLEAMTINEEQRQEAQRRTNKANSETKKKKPIRSL